MRSTGQASTAWPDSAPAEGHSSALFSLFTSDRTSVPTTTRSRSRGHSSSDRSCRTSSPMEGSSAATSRRKAGLPAGRLYEYPAHGLRRDGQKVRPILKPRLRFVYQSYIGLVNQGGGLQCVVGSLLTQVLPGHSPQLFVDERKKLMGRRIRPFAHS